jgi:hypothetical protein
MPEESKIPGLVKVVRGWSIAARWSAIVMVCVVAIAIVSLLAPIPQSQSYHHFADQRSIAGIPHGMDVLSNLAFLFSGVLGLIFILRAGFVLDGGTRWAFATLFFGLILTSLGSGYYHLAPTNQSLVFDRLPMIVAMSGCVGAVIADRFGGATAWSVILLLVVGLWTVYEWNTSEQARHSDLRWYALYQGLVILIGALLLLLFASRNGATKVFVIAVAGNVLAKIFELLDKPIFALGGIISGHTLKHLSAGLAFLPLAFFVHQIEQRHIFADKPKQALAGSGR